MKRERTSLGGGERIKGFVFTRFQPRKGEILVGLGFNVV